MINVGTKYGVLKLHSNSETDLTIKNFDIVSNTVADKTKIGLKKKMWQSKFVKWLY